MDWPGSAARGEAVTGSLCNAAVQGIARVCVSRAQHAAALVDRRVSIAKGEALTSGFVLAASASVTRCECDSRACRVFALVELVGGASKSVTRGCILAARGLAT